MVGGRGDVKALHGLTIIAVGSAELDELTGERIGALESLFDLSVELGMVIEVAANFGVDFLVKTLPLNHDQVVEPSANLVSTVELREYQKGGAVLLDQMTRYQKLLPPVFQSN